MLRTLVLALVLANGTYLAWSQGFLKVYGFAPASQAEPQRLAQQIRPEAIQLLKAIPAPAPAPTVPPDTGPPADDTAVDNAQKPGASADVDVPQSLMAAGGASAPEPGASAAFVPAVALAAAPALKSASAPAVALAAVPALKSASAPAVVRAAVPISAPAAARASAPASARAPTFTADATPVSVPALVRIATVAPAPAAPAPAARQCLQAGLFTEQQASAMRARLQARLPAGSWSFVGTREPARWIVYMGRYVGKDELQKKRVLLKQAGVPFATPLSPQLNPGLSLGSFKTKAQAEAALARLSTRGVRSARVVQELTEPPTLWLRLPAADVALQARAKALIPQLSGKRLQACS